jgi:C1A family cysteine protease
MKSFCLVAILALLCFSFVYAKDPIPREIYKQFLKFEVDFSKTYDSPEERHYRIQVFANNLHRVKELNEANGSPAFGITKFMDLTEDEFKAAYLSGVTEASGSLNAQHLEIQPKNPQDLPPEVDWRNVTGVITPVKNQEQCGSCWAFSATEAIESAWVLSGKPQVILGPQQIVDCDQQDGGCNGGRTETAYDYVIHAGGQETEKDYPYRAVNGNCKFNKADIAASITSWKYISTSAAGELTKMMPYVAESGPVSVCVDAAPWQYYTGGVLKVCGNQVDHCVQVTGYSTVDNLPVWNVRNSWGEDWGEQGYIWVERGKNLCAIAGDVTVPIV